MVVVDKLTKATHFVLIKSTFKELNIVDVYMKEVVRMHGIPKAIILDKDYKFTLNFWKEVFKEFGIKLNFRTTYHPYKYG